jgi:Tfp pilus assembly protein PilX
MTKQKEEGLVLVMVMVMVSALLLIGLALISQTTSQYILTGTTATNNNAMYTAEAGIEQSIQQLNASSDFSGYATAQTFFNTATQGFGTYTTSITPASGNNNAKVITSTGKIYKYSDHAKLLSSRTVQVTVVGTTAEGYSVMTGPGGLILTGSANITNSSVFVGGTITLTGAAKIGTAAKPLQVDAGNKACPSGANPGSSYPSLCTSSQPISMDWSTNIYGTVCATGQTSKGPNNNIQPGNGGQGLLVGCTAPDVSTPTYSRTDHINSMTTSGSATDNTYVCSSWPFNRTWPANLKLTGNVVIDSSCNVTIKGNVYITGTLTIGGAAHIKVDDSVGATRPVIVADGKITVGGSAAITANSSGTGAEFISFASNAACGATCTSITGTALKATSTYETVNVGGAVSVPGVVFNAYWGQATIAGSGNIGSAVGQTVNLSGAGTVTFGTKLSSGVSTWTISSYQIKYPNQ